MFDFGILQPFVDDENITDIDTNSRCVYVTHQQKGKYKALELEEGFLDDLLIKLSNYPQIDEEFNFHNPVLDGTLDGLRIHAVHKTIMHPYCWLSIRKNPHNLVVKEKDYSKIFDLIKVANQLKWSYVFGGERGSGKTQWTRSSLALIDPSQSITIIAENDEMHMQELFPDRLISQYVINDIMNYKMCAASVLRDNSDYVVFQEVRDSAIDDLLLILSSTSRVLTTLHVKNALLMPERMIELSEQTNDQRLTTVIHDYIQMCIVPCVKKENGKLKRYISEIALFWNDENHEPKKQLIYTSNGSDESYLPLPEYYLDLLKKNKINFAWTLPKRRS